MEKIVKLIRNLSQDVADIDSKIKKLEFRKAEILQRIGILERAVLEDDSNSTCRPAQVADTLNFNQTEVCSASVKQAPDTITAGQGLPKESNTQNPGFGGSVGGAVSKLTLF